MPKNVTYLLGAGASANALPTVKEFPLLLKALISQLGMYDMDSEISSSLDFLLKSISEQQSIDTYAKMLWLKGELENLTKTKHLIVLVFELIQYFIKNGLITNISNEQGYITTKQSFDNRYDAFLAGILNQSSLGQIEFPKNLNILSWNYDYELEKAINKYTNRDYLEDICNKVQGVHVLLKGSSLKYYPNDPIENDFFKIIKINGTIGSFIKDRTKLFLGYSSTSETGPLSKEGIRRYFNAYRESLNNNIPAISFAWENDLSVNDTINYTKKIMAKTDILVVIGYSFPYFNRTIDRNLLSSENAPNLKKIYIQDGKADDVIETIKGFRDNDWKVPEGGDFNFNSEEFPFIPKYSTDQFYMPHEL